MRFLTFALLSLIVSAVAFGQSAAGLASISGVVRDSEGAAVPNARLEVSNTAQGTVRKIARLSGTPRSATGNPGASLAEM